MMSFSFLTGLSSTVVMIVPRSRRFQARILVCAIVPTCMLVSSTALAISGCGDVTNPMVG